LIATALAARLPAEGRSPIPTWPRDREDPPLKGAERPLVSFLLSGGVFRGVYQVGVLNALSEVELRPDIVAGASVGSIMGAMTAQVFCADGLSDRRRRIARLAATFLALDRLILSDRFADFIRTLTLRAAETRFSVRDADQAFRRYDGPGGSRYGEILRLVAAGLERLFYLSPYELNDLVRMVRTGQWHAVVQRVRAHVQEWLDRMGVGDQILGAEPLALLIIEHVLRPGGWLDPGWRGGPLAPEQVPFDAFLEPGGIYFLATTTNLSLGRLEVLGEQQLAGPETRATLLNGLLASSAFPGVFRPRKSWEVMPMTRHSHQYTDGGVMDNLPLDAVAQFLHAAAEGGLIAPRPLLAGDDVPHLLFSASLQELPPEPEPADLERYTQSWPEILVRARKLGYNKKLELYQETQRAMRSLYQGFGERPGWKPLDLEVLMVRPDWLCGTFAFHPMLGFRRARQGASIAHGCATTLRALARAEQAKPAWTRAWGVKLAAQADYPVPDPCWLRPGVTCPFARSALRDSGLPTETVNQLDTIYRTCLRHERGSIREG
jgi:predicted acylesterase/phospholipase RssA